eukprot:6026668-Ditylum_brightwellii.AAC.1
MAAKYDPEVLTYWQTMSGDKAEYWFKATDKEIDNLMKFKIWEVISKSNTRKKFPLGNIVPTMWVLK